MKTLFKVSDISEGEENFQEGFIEVDDETNEIAVRAIARRFFSKEEKLLMTAKYSATNFPQFENGKITVGSASAQMVSTSDQQKIMDILTKPWKDLKNSVIENVKVAENALKEALASRANALDYLALLRDNPRKFLFSNGPELMTNSKDPVEVAVNQQKSIIASSIKSFRENMTTWANNKLLDQSTCDAYFEIAVSIGGAQDAIFQGNDVDVQASDLLLHSMGVAEPTIAAFKLGEMTQVLADELASKMRQAAVNRIVGVAKCEKCGKYFKVSSDQRCTFCHSGFGLG